MIWCVKCVRGNRVHRGVGDGHGNIRQRRKARSSRSECHRVMRRRPTEGPAHRRRQREGGLHAVRVHRLAELDHDWRQTSAPQVVACVGELLITTGSSGRSWLRANKNLASHGRHCDLRSLRRASDGDGLVRVEQVRQHGAGGVSGGTIRERLTRGRGVEYDENFLRTQFTFVKRTSPARRECSSGSHVCR